MTKVKGINEEKDTQKRAASLPSSSKRKKVHINVLMKDSLNGGPDGGPELSAPLSPFSLNTPTC